MSVREQLRREHRRRVGFDLDALRHPAWPQLGVRFLFGAGIALGAGLIGAKFGPLTGGLFLAFPAILPAALTLLERKDGVPATDEDAVGATWGAVAMLVFAVVVGVLAAGVQPLAAVGLAGIAWCVAAGALFAVGRLLLRRL